MNDRDYAIVVGINLYPQLRVLKAASADAVRFIEWLKAPAGGDLPEDNIQMIQIAETLPADPSDARPIQEDIDRALRDIGVELNKRIGRRLYFYFAGHGIGPTFDDVGMLMAHAASTRLKRNIGLRPYRQYFHEHVLFDELVFILDCCRDPTLSFQTGEPDFTVENGPEGPVQDFVMLAAAYGEKAFEPTDRISGEPRGLLTQAVLEGLQLPAAADKLGRFTASSLREYVRRRVPELATDARLRQEPEVDLPMNEIVFGTVRQERVSVRIVSTSGAGGNLVLRDSDMVEIERRAAAEATEKRSSWDVSLVRNSWYIVERTSDPPGTSQVLLDLRKVESSTHVFHVP